jgi:hypothetical protein
MHSPTNASGALTRRSVAYDDALPAPLSHGEVLIGGRRYVTADRLATMLGKSPRTIGRWNAARIGPPRISVGKLILFDVIKVQDWLASLESEPVALAARSSGPMAKKSVL